MALENETIVVGILLAVNYLFLYKKNKFFGNIVVMGTGMALFLMPNLTDITRIAGILTLMIGIISLIYDFVAPKKK